MTPFSNTITTILSLSLSLTLCYNSNAKELIAGLNYGDSRNTVAQKLTSSEQVKSNVTADLIGRIGINGSYTTTQKLSDLKFSLYFDWDQADRLQQLTYRSDSLPDTSYHQNLKSSWQYAINLISSIYGKAINAGDYPKKNDIKPDTIFFSHEWKISNGYIYLGIGQEEQENKNYSLNIRFSKVALSAE